ncbi:hypothetical protein O3P69_018745 [Scylla paramamosain]|uniref:Uncharacterized protein n=1 Tax=Scylla paramamosain TaxID=85552 RepID=A0AAW0STD5_SCYPA
MRAQCFSGRVGEPHRSPRLPQVGYGHYQRQEVSRHCDGEIVETQTDTRGPPVVTVVGRAPGSGEGDAVREGCACCFSSACSGACHTKRRAAWTGDRR